MLFEALDVNISHLPPPFVNSWIRHCAQLYSPAGGGGGRGSYRPLAFGPWTKHPHKPPWRIKVDKTIIIPHK